MKLLEPTGPDLIRDAACNLEDEDDNEVVLDLLFLVRSGQYHVQVSLLLEEHEPGKIICNRN